MEMENSIEVKYRKKQMEAEIRNILINFDLSFEHFNSIQPVTWQIVQLTTWLSN